MYILLLTRHSQITVKQLTDTTEMHSKHSRLYIYVTDTQWVCTAARTPVTLSTKKDPSAAASI